MNSSTVVSFSGAPKISLVRASSKKTRRSGSRYHDPSWAALSACCRRTAGLADRSGLSMKMEIIRFAPSCDGILSRAARHYLHAASRHPRRADTFRAADVQGWRHPNRCAQLSRKRAFIGHGLISSGHRLIWSLDFEPMVAQARQSRKALEKQTIGKSGGSVVGGMSGVGRHTRLDPVPWRISLLRAANRDGL